MTYGDCILSVFCNFRYHEFKKLKKQDRNVCMNCGLLLLPGEVTEHQGHVIKGSVSKQLLRRPTELFTPLDNNKTYAVSSVIVTFMSGPRSSLGNKYLPLAVEQIRRVFGDD